MSGLPAADEPIQVHTCTVSVQPPALILPVPSVRGQWQTARQAAGPPGLRVQAARARDRTGADQATREESQLIAAIATRPDPWQYSICPDPWEAASTAWLAAGLP